MSANTEVVPAGATFYLVVGDEMGSGGFRSWYGIEFYTSTSYQYFDLAYDNMKPLQFKAGGR